MQQQTTLDKKNYFSHLLENSGPNSRKYWQVVGRVTGRERKGINKIQFDSAVYDVSENQLFVANYFVGVTQNLAAKFTNPTFPLFPNSHCTNTQNTNPNSFFIFPISPTEIINAVNSISSKNSVGTDSVSSEVLKNCLYALLTPLEILFNLSVIEGIFPDLLKEMQLLSQFLNPVHKPSYQIIDRSLYFQ